MAWLIYDQFRLKEMNGNGVDFGPAGDTLKIALVTSGYTLNAALHDFWDDANAFEVSGTNYSAGGEALIVKTLTLAAGIVTFDAADISWPQSVSGFNNARRPILYKETGVPGTSPLIAYDDFGADKGNVDQALSLNWDSFGLITSP